MRIGIKVWITLWVNVSMRTRNRLRYIDETDGTANIDKALCTYTYFRVIGTFEQWW